MDMDITEPTARRVQIAKTTDLLGASRIAVDGLTGLALSTLSDGEKLALLRDIISTLEEACNAATKLQGFQTFKGTRA